MTTTERLTVGDWAEAIAGNHAGLVGEVVSIDGSTIVLRTQLGFTFIEDSESVRPAQRK